MGPSTSSTTEVSYSYAVCEGRIAWSRTSPDSQTTEVFYAKLEVDSTVPTVTSISAESDSSLQNVDTDTESPTSKGGSGPRSSSISPSRVGFPRRILEGVKDHCAGPIWLRDVSACESGSLLVVSYGNELLVTKISTSEKTTSEEKFRFFFEDLNIHGGASDNYMVTQIVSGTLPQNSYIAMLLSNGKRDRLIVIDVSVLIRGAQSFQPNNTDLDRFIIDHNTNCSFMVAGPEAIPFRKLNESFIINVEFAQGITDDRYFFVWDFCYDEEVISLDIYTQYRGSKISFWRVAAVIASQRPGSSQETDALRFSVSERRGRLLLLEADLDLGDSTTSNQKELVTIRENQDILHSWPTGLACQQRYSSRS